MNKFRTGLTTHTYKCPDCRTKTFEGDRNHYRMWDLKGGHCVVNGDVIE